MDPRALRQVLTQLTAPQPEWWDALGTVSAETLVLAGGASSHLNQRSLSALARALPRGRLLTIEAGHRVHTKQPDAYLATAIPFLAPSIVT